MLLVVLLNMAVGRLAYSGDRIPMGARSPHLSRTALRPTQPPVQWVPGLFRGKVPPGRDADPLPSSSAEVKNRVGLYLYSP